VHFATDHDSDVIVGVAVRQTPSDQTALLPMLSQIDRRLDASPATMLVDGGFVAHDAIDEVTRRGVRLLAPVPHRPGSADPVPIHPGDSMAVALWRARMQTADAKQQYRARGAIAERVNADVRTHRTLGRLQVRGLSKVHSWVLWIALAHNAMRMMGIVPHLMT
jgi:DDE family transposase